MTQTNPEFNQLTRINKLLTLMFNLKDLHFEEREERIVRRITLDKEEYSYIDKSYVLTRECLQYVKDIKNAGYTEIEAGYISKHFGFASYLEVKERIEVLEELLGYLKEAKKEIKTEEV